jgi:hypothetical protein
MIKKPNNTIKGQQLVYINALENWVMINILDTTVVEKYKTSPHHLLVLGVVDFYNIVYRISQYVATKNIKKLEVRDTTSKILSNIIANIMKASVEYEAGVPLEDILAPIEYKITDKDKEFLKTLRLDSRSL